MRITVNLGTELLAEASRLTGVTERTTLIHAGLWAQTERESAPCLASLGGSQPGLELVPRRRSGRLSRLPV